MMMFLAESCEGDQEIEKNTQYLALGGGGQMYSEIALPASACHHIHVKHKANNRY
jgi:hypothetical protein